MASDDVLSAPVACAGILPEAVLCDDPAAALAADPAVHGATWWHGHDLEGRTWPARSGGPDAVPTDPNTRSAGELRGPHGLRCTAGFHCGFVARNAAPDAAMATLAVRWTTPPGGEARTLLTLNTGGAARKTEGENYLFLSEADGALTVQDDAGHVSLVVPCPPRGGAHLAVVTLDRECLTLCLDGAWHRAEADAPVLDGPASLFIAARNQRPKLLKTLGTADIHDVWLWPGTRLDHRGVTALQRYHLWADG